MNAINNKRIRIIDGITLVMILMFPLIPSYDHELFMTLLFLIGVLTFFNNFILIKFNYKSEATLNETFKSFAFIWAKMFVFSILLSACVEASYLNWAVSNAGELNIYSNKAIIGWELMVHFYKWVLFYVPIIASVNALMFLIVSAALLAFRNKPLKLMINKLTKSVKETSDEVSSLVKEFNLKVLNIFKINKQQQNAVYLSNYKSLLISNRKAQVPPVFFF